MKNIKRTHKKHKTDKNTEKKYLLRKTESIS